MSDTHNGTSHQSRLEADGGSRQENDRKRSRAEQMQVVLASELRTQSNENCAMNLADAARDCIPVRVRSALAISVALVQFSRLGGRIIFQDPEEVTA